jgi:hypothetical protein
MSQEYLAFTRQHAASFANAECAREFETGEPSESVVGVRGRLWNAELLERHA